jgi:pyrophosphatase PpaX
VTDDRPIALLFDLDGTLVDTTELILGAMRHAFADYPGRRPSDADWVRGVGKPLRVQMLELAEQPGHVDGLVARYRTWFWEHHDGMTRPFPEAAELLAGLRAGGHPVGVVTAKLEEPARRSLERAGLWRSIDVVVGADSLPEHKPDPAPVRLALSRLGRRPDEAVLVGDSPHDVAAGNAAGVATAAALWGASPHQALLAAHPRWLLSSLGEVRDLVRAFDRGRRA